MAIKLPPPPLKAEPGDFTWLDWYNKLYTSLAGTGGIAWTAIDFTGSSIGDIANRNHALLTGVQGGIAGERYHLTAAQYANVGNLGSMAYQNANNVAITGGLISNTTLSGVTIDNSAPYLTFANGVAVTNAAGRMWYDGTAGSWNLGMGGGNITQQVGEELFVYGKASAAINDSPLQIIYQTGTVGASGVITFAPTVSGITNGDLIIGVATEPIANNAKGRITSFGVIHGITTNGTAYGETWHDGDAIWYNPVTGNPTNVKPVAPNIKVQVGTIINAGSGGSGSFQVEVSHGSILGGTDANVEFSGLATNNLIQYNGTYWANVAALNSMPIGSTTPSTGAFTSLSSTVTGTGGAVNVTYNPSSTSGSAVQTTGKNTQGGTGYFDFLKVTNTSTGATNPNKTFRVNTTGQLELVNSAYSAILMSITDAGVLHVSDIEFGTYTANLGLTTQGYITIKDSSGTTRRLAVV